jgi:hypothetical protein
MANLEKKFESETQQKHVQSDLVKWRISQGEMTLEKAMQLTTKDKLPDKGNLECFGLGYYSQMEIWEFQLNRSKIRMIELGFKPEEIDVRTLKFDPDNSPKGWFTEAHAKYIEEGLSDYKKAIQKVQEFSELLTDLVEDMKKMNIGKFLETLLNRIKDLSYAQVSAMCLGLTRQQVRVNNVTIEHVKVLESWTKHNYDKVTKKQISDWFNDIKDLSNSQITKNWEAIVVSRDPYESWNDLLCSRDPYANFKLRLVFEQQEKDKGNLKVLYRSESLPEGIFALRFMVPNKERTV